MLSKGTSSFAFSLPPLPHYSSRGEWPAWQQDRCAQDKAWNEMILIPNVAPFNWDTTQLKNGLEVFPRGCTHRPKYHVTTTWFLNWFHLEWSLLKGKCKRKQGLRDQEKRRFILVICHLTHRARDIVLRINSQTTSELSRNLGSLISCNIILLYFVVK